MNVKRISKEEKECLLFLQGIDGWGSKTIELLKKEFGTYKNIYNSSPGRLGQIVSDRKVENFEKHKQNVNPAKEYEKMKEAKIRQVMLEEDDYPIKLKNIADPPPAIYVKGRLPNENIPAVAIIGARNNSSYGMAMARTFSKTVTENGIQIISGMALGIDGIAQRESIVNGGKTFAVLGCGADICYPATNRNLYYDILRTGGIISEYVPGTAPIPQRFPPRNRIISGLSDAIIVIEAAQKSGTLITVDMALEQGREVYALPGRLGDNLSEGCNRLVHQGANILTSPEEFIEEFLTNIQCMQGYADFVHRKINHQKNGDSGMVKKQPDTPEERAIYQILEYTPQSLDEILVKVNEDIPMPLTGLMQWLTNMCISGYVTCIAGTNYQKNR